MLVIKCHSYYRRCKTKNPCCSFDAHFQDGVGGSTSLSHFIIKAANTVFMTLYNLSPPRSPKGHDQQSLTHHWGSFGGCGRAYFAVFVDDDGGQYILNGQWCTNVNILGSTVASLNVTINSETWNVQLEIGTDWSSQIQQNISVDMYGSRIGRPGSSGQNCSRFWNRTDLFLLFKPGLLVGYPNPLLTERLTCPKDISERLRITDITWGMLPSNRTVALCWLTSECLVGTCRALFRCIRNCLWFVVVTFWAPYTRTAIAAQILWILCSPNW
jgi:hypothetical protein